MSVGPGWYPSNVDPNILMFWDGARWTGETRPASSGPHAGLPTSLPTSPRGSGGGMSTPPVGSVPPKPSADPRVSPDGRFYWNGAAWEPLAQPFAPPVPPRMDRASQGKVPKRRMPVWAIVLIVLGALAGLGLVLLGVLAAIGSSVISSTQAGAQSELVKSNVVYTAKNLEAFYAVRNVYPSQTDLLYSDYFFDVSPGVTVSVAYYDEFGDPVGQMFATGYVLCGFSAGAGEAFAYDSAKGGLALSGVKAVDGVNPCSIVTEFVTAGGESVAWNPNDVNFVLASGGFGVSPEGSVEEPGGIGTV